MEEKIIIDYLSFLPLKTIAVKYQRSIADLEQILTQEIREKRAEQLLKNLPQVSEALPEVIRTAIYQLGLLADIANRQCSDSIEDLTLLEKIKNYSLKSQLADYSMWSADIDLPSELTLKWVISVSHDVKLAELEKYAKVLLDKITLKEQANVQVRYVEDWDNHQRLCKQYNLDPMETKESELREHIENVELMNDYVGGKITEEEFNERLKKLNKEGDM